MEYVELPIFDANGFDTGKRLKINTRYFLGSAGSITAHRDIEVVKPDPVAEELEMVDRIIAGLPPKPSYLGPLDLERNQPLGLWDFIDKLPPPIPSAHFVWDGHDVVQQVFPEEVEFKSGKKPPHDNWKTIENIDSGNFEINEEGIVRNRQTRRELPLKYNDQFGTHYKLVINRVPVTIVPDELVKQLFN